MQFRPVRVTRGCWWQGGMKGLVVEMMMMMLGGH